MVHFGVGGQIVSDSGLAYPQSSEDVQIETNKIVSLM